MGVSDIGLVRQTLLNRLYGRTQPSTLVGLSTQLSSIHSLLHRTVANLEGNSVLLIGPRGSGKSTLIQKALSLLHHHKPQQEHRQEQEQGQGQKKTHHVVKLSGFIHTTDKIALRDIARQLLITQDLENILIGSFSDAFTYILQQMRTDSSDRPIPLVFILEEFDLLAQHPKQSLLYTLFDIAQQSQRQTPIAVKRVKSRFSHRQVYVQYTRSLEEFAQIFREALSTGDPGFDHRVDEVLADAPVRAYILEAYEFSKDPRRALRVFASAVARLSQLRPALSLDEIRESVGRERASAKMQVLRGISLLELYLLVAMRGLLGTGSGKFNFEMVYAEYKLFMSRYVMGSSGSMKVYKKPVAMKAFETLVELEIVRGVGEGNATAGGVSGRNDLLAASGRAPKEYRMVQMMLEPGQVVELVEAREDVPAVVRRWAQQ
ncbi:origin recognition complex subunit 4 C-terminus-domain-containing protein [Kickxella alabastrina]|uniref:origin recognition complex subunit 4 C-terminus-domain-containing protein n=1 Tax=Kickxella alabastrina TaxID=61397 RepID=UPI00221EC9E9|nr:origin recognition complex subunit 4 C-terminus-domain-containing protein [Kickxella alabastrina]KAI7826733.1 origin recognition complex subunit 4 C-terminus-domain-containing protein [Kickxella alabastrina]